MNFAENDNKMAIHAYISTLSGLKLGDNFLARINEQILELITLILHHLFSRENEYKCEDFLIDLEAFVVMMKDKYSSNSQYNHSPLSHIEKLSLKNMRERGNTSKKENNFRFCSHDEFNL